MRFTLRASNKTASQVESIVSSAQASGNDPLETEQPILVEQTTCKIFHPEFKLSSATLADWTDSHSAERPTEIVRPGSEVVDGVSPAIHFAAGRRNL